MILIFEFGGPRLIMISMATYVANLNPIVERKNPHIRIWAQSLSIWIFFQYFTENLIEAVGGYKDFEHQPPSGDEREGLVRNW